MAHELLSPELVLVDPELGARARAALPQRASPPTPPRRTPRPVAPGEAPAPHHAPARPYPIWARITAALWLLVLGILIGGAAIPHAQDKPRVVPPGEDPSAAICEQQDAMPPPTPPTPRINPGNPFGIP